MVKKGGIRHNWIERFFVLDAAGVLRYYKDVVDRPIKRGGSTKIHLEGYDEAGVIHLKDASEIRCALPLKPKHGAAVRLLPASADRALAGRARSG